MAFRLLYHPLVKSEDLARIAAKARARIRRALEERAAVDPARYGKPLRFTLRGLWSLRVGAYRVIYSIQGEEVCVLKIGHRREVYREAHQRRRSRQGEAES